jgi:hypothetical protein
MPLLHCVPRRLRSHPRRRNTPDGVWARSSPIAVPGDGEGEIRAEQVKWS